MDPELLLDSADTVVRTHSPFGSIITQASDSISRKLSGNHGECTPDIDLANTRRGCSLSSRSPSRPQDGTGRRAANPILVQNTVDLFFMPCTFRQLVSSAPNHAYHMAHKASSIASGLPGLGRWHPLMLLFHTTLVARRISPRPFRKVTDAVRCGC